MNSSLIRYIVTNGLFLWLLYYGWVTGSAGAHAVVAFFIVLAFFVSLLSLFEAVRVQMRNLKLPVPQGFDIVFDILIAIFLVWSGSWFLGTLWILHSFLLHSAIRSEPPGAEGEVQA